MSKKKAVISGAMIVAATAVSASGAAAATTPPESAQPMRLTETGLMVDPLELDRDVRTLGAHTRSFDDSDGIRLSQTWSGGTGGDGKKAPIKGSKDLKGGNKTKGDGRLQTGTKKTKKN